MELDKYNSGVPRVLKHILFWVGYVLFFSILYGSFKEDYAVQFQLQLIFLPEKIAVTYFTLYYLMPRYLLSGRYTPFFALLGGVMLVFGFVHWVMVIYVEHPIYFPEEDWNLTLLHPAKIIKSVTYIYPVVAIAVVIKFIKHWFRNQQTTQRLTQDKLEAELKFLKAQIHPHFLFNTLNNLYALTLKKSDHAPEMVLKLSDLLNYMLYECNADRVPLKKEIELLENYLSLEKIRYGKRLDLSFNVKGDISGKFIAPMLILPFVENSFKHGVSGETKDAWVGIDLNVKGDQMTLKVENSKSDNGAKDERNYKEGIGLKNVKRRLELLYSANYDLKTFDTDETYLIVLKLGINEEPDVKLTHQPKIKETDEAEVSYSR